MSLEVVSFLNISPKVLSSRDMKDEMSSSVVPIAHAICNAGETRTTPCKRHSAIIISCTPSSKAWDTHQCELQSQRTRFPPQFAYSDKKRCGYQSSSAKIIWNPILSLFQDLIWPKTLPSIFGSKYRATSLHVWQPTNQAPFLLEQTAARAASQETTTLIAPSTKA